MNNATVSLTGSASATLPLFFPNATTPLGERGNNNINLTIGNLADIANTTTITTPDFRALSNVSLTGKLNILIDGLDLLLSTLQKGLNSQVLANLPLVGNNLEAGPLHRRLPQLGRQPAQGSARRGGRHGPARVVQHTGPNGLGILLPLSGTGTPTLNDVQVAITANQVQFNLNLGQTYTVGGSTAFDMDLPGLGHDGQQCRRQRRGLDWQFDLGFGVSRSRRFLPGRLEGERAVDRPQRHCPRAQHHGRLGFLNLGLQDNPANPSKFGARVRRGRPGAIILPPSSAAFAADSSTLSTPTDGSQWGGTPLFRISSEINVIPPSGA